MSNFIRAVKTKDINELKKLASLGPVDPNAFLIAVEKSRLPIIECLIEGGADVNARVAGRQSPISIAVVCGRLEVAEFLIKNGATMPNNILYDTIRIKSISMAKLLISYGADVNRRFGDKTVLMCAVEADNDDLVQLLLDSGADRDVITRNGRTALHMTRSITMYDLLVAAGADPTIRDLNGELAARENEELIAL